MKRLIAVMLIMMLPAGNQSRQADGGAHSTAGDAANADGGEHGGNDSGVDRCAAERDRLAG